MSDRPADQGNAASRDALRRRMADWAARMRSLRSRVSLVVLHGWNFLRYGSQDVFANIAIETYSPCNRTCACCPVGHERRPVRKMPEELFRRIIDQLAARKYAGEIALHFYNEPTLDQRLGELIRYAHERCPRSYIYFSSNGDFLTLEKFRGYVRAGLSEVHLTQYDREPKPALRDFLAGLTAEDRRHVHFRVKVVDDYPYWRNRAGHLPDRRLANPLVRRCLRPERQLVIDAAGKVAQCCCDYRADRDLGDAAAGNVFDIWRSAAFHAIRKHLRKGDRAAIPLCRECDWPDEIVGRFGLPRARKAEQRTTSPDATPARDAS